MATRVPAWMGGHLRLRHQVAFALGLIALVSALVVSGATLLFAQSYLLDQRESAALTRALVNGNVTEVALSEGAEPGDALNQVPSVGDSVPMLNYRGVWYTQGVTVSPSELPPALLESAVSDSGAWQRFEGNSDDPYLGVAMPVTDGVYVEVFPLGPLDESIRALGFLLGAASILAFMIGGAVGRWAGVLLLAPLRGMARVAERITAGDLSARVEPSNDPDLDTIATAFNEMAETVEDRLNRERRFSANVSHELRSPLTGVLGTAEILEGRLDRMPPTEARLVSALASQVRRFSSLVLDLLELSRIGGDESVQNDVVDIRTFVVGLLRDRDLGPDLVEGEGGTVRTDRRRLERIIGNLIENAGKHGSGLRKIVLEMRTDSLAVHVDDQGSGVAMADRGPIFEPFNRGGKTDRKGSGLGLAIAAEQARLLGATIDIDDAPGGGARFTVSLPDVMPW